MGETGKTAGTKLSARGVRSAALALVQRKGIDFSMRDLARELGAAPMAAYRYYPSRDELINALVEDVMAAIVDEKLEATLGDGAIEWPERLVKFGMLVYDRLIAYPGMAQPIVLGAAIAPSAARLGALLIGFLVQRGIALEDASRKVQTMITFLLMMASLDFQRVSGATEPEKVAAFADRQRDEDRVSAETLDRFLGMTIRERAETGLRLMTAGLERLHIAR